MAKPGAALLILAAMVCWAWAEASGQSKTVTATTLVLTSGGSSVTTVESGTMVTLTATVTAGGNAVSPGLVKFCDADAANCSDVHSVGSAQLRSDGIAVWRFRPGPGTHAYKAVFAGTNTRAASASASVTLTVTATTGQNPAVALVSSTGSWGSYSLIATVAETGGTLPLTGSVSYRDTSNANAVIATLPLGASIPGLSWSAQTPIDTPMSPTSMIVGDFNRDGIPDVATTDSRTQTINAFVSQTNGAYQQSFVTSDSYTPAGLIAADFDSDGNLDIAVPNASSNTLTILLGHGDGTFTVSTVHAGRINTALVTADFNGDGIADLAVADGFSGAVAILLGNGDGSFMAAPTLSVSSAAALATGDFNGDENIDLAVTANGGIDIFTGAGDGTFNAPSTVTVPGNGSLTRVISGDFNGDSKLDLAVSNGTNVVPTKGQVVLLLGNGDATFSPSTPSITPEAPIRLALTDFNLDGVPDLAAIDLVGNITVLVGVGDGTFGSQFQVPMSVSFSQSFATGDMNGDGTPDLIALGSGPTNTIVLAFLLTKPTETASTAPAPITLSGIGEHLVVASYSGDANSTSATSSPLSLWGVPPATITTLAMTAGGSPVSSVEAKTVVTLTAAVTVGQTPLTSGTVSFCDATAPMCADTALVGSATLTANGTATFRFVPGPGQHSYKAEFQQNAYGIKSSSPAVNLAVEALAHVQGSTTTTIAVTEWTIGDYGLTATVAGIGSTVPITGNISFLDANFANAVVATAPLGPSTAGLAWHIASTTDLGNAPYIFMAEDDFNGDGFRDIAAVNNTSTVTLMLGKGDGTFTASTAAIVGGYTTAVAAGDFNGDGVPDLAVTWMAYVGYSEKDSLTILLGKGDGTFAEVAGSPALSSYTHGLAAADINGDGNLDLVVNDSSGTRILLGNADGTFTQGPATGFASTMAIGDLNGDAIPDLVVGFINNMPVVYLGKGDGSFLPATGTTLTAGNQYGAVVIADFNSDGKPDIAYTGWAYTQVTVSLGNGDGTFTAVPSGSIPSVNDPRGISAADLNHDGKLDLLITNANAYIGNSFNPDITVLLGSGDGTFTSLPGDTQLGATGSIVAADFDGDGTPDIAVQTGKVSVLLTAPSQTATAVATGVNPSGPAPHNVDASYPGDSNYNGSVSGTVSLDVQVAKPVFTPASGTYTSSQTVTLADATPGATIYYSTNLSPFGQWTTYTGPISLDTQGTFTFYTYATATGYQQSAQASATYTLNLPAAAAPVITPGTGSYPGPQTVTIASSSGARIYYTVDGTRPTTQSAVYTGPLTVSTSEVIVAMASGGGYSSSPLSTAQILINSSADSFIYTVAGNESSGYSGDGGPATAAAMNFPVSVLPDSAGNLYIADASNCVVRRVDARSGTINTFAGNGTCGYSGDSGDATKAQLNQPWGLALDRFGNVYISEYVNGVIRKVDADGTITTFAGSNTATSAGDGGAATSAQITKPTGLIFDTAGNLYIASQSRIRMVAAETGAISTLAGNGTYGYSGDGGPARSATVANPSALVLDVAGNLYFTDSIGVVRKVTKAGIISTVAGQSPYGNTTSIGDGGPATSAVLSSPNGLAVDVSGNLFIADSGNYEIRKVTASDGIIHRVVGFAGMCVTMSGDGGLAADAGICAPYGISFDAAGNLYIAELRASRVRKVTTTALPPTSKTAAPVFDVQPDTYATAQTVNVSSSTPGTAIYVTLDGNDPTTIGAQWLGPLDVSGSITLKAVAVAPGYLISDATTATYTITAPPPSVINTIAGTDAAGTAVTPTPPLPATSLNFGWLYDLAADDNGNVYIPDQSHAVVWMVSAATGEASIVAGTLNRLGETGDGDLATSAQLYAPTHVALGKNGDFYITEAWSRRVRKVSGGIITTYAGGGSSYGGLGDGGPATSAFLNNPLGVAVDASGTLYIADAGTRSVRKVTTDGIISTAAGGGTSGVLGDGGPATSATLGNPVDVAVDATGNLYIADSSAARVRKVTVATGIISTYAGSGIRSSGGDGLAATKTGIDPRAVTVDSKGNVFIANYPYTVRMVDSATQIVKTVAGSGYGGFSGDGGSATMATTCLPSSVATDKVGSLYFLDQCNFRVRKVTFSGVELLHTATPTFSPASGTYAGAQTVTIADTTPAAQIYYTIDGSIPTTGSTPYSSPITVASSKTIQAIATAPGYLNSPVASATYIINIPVNPIPIMNSLTPAIKTAGSASFTLNIGGSGFVSSSTVFWGSTALSTQYVDGSTLTALVPAASLASAGIVSITVQTLSPGGGTSNELRFEIDTVGSTPPSFRSTTSTVTAGSAATYPVSLPSSATNISASCLNLPTGASCSYSASAQTLTISTSGTTPKGTYQITVVFTETLPGAAAFLLPVLLLPFATKKRRTRFRLVLLVLVAGMAIFAAGAGCGGGGGDRGGTTPPPSTHQVTSSGIVSLTVQ